MFSEAKWIWRANEAGQDEYVDFLDSFTAAAGEKVTLTISADSNYTVYINGQLAAFGQYADYPKYKVADTVDITEFVREGENRLAIVVWYFGVESFTYTCGKAGLIYEVKCGCGKVLAKSDESVLSRLDPGYVHGLCHMVSGQLGLTYHVDNVHRDRFITEDVPGFAPSRAVEGISTEFHPRPNKKLVLQDRLPAKICQQGTFTYTTDSAVASENMQYAALVFKFLAHMAKDIPNNYVLKEGSKPVCLTTDREAGIYFIVDLKEETAGFLDFDIEVPHDCRIDIGWGEHLDDGRCRTSIRGFFCDVQAKAGRNTYLNTFRRMGCRYVQFFIHAKEATIHYAGIRPTVYPLNVKKYVSGNLLRDTIYDVCEKTLIHCVHEHYEDCPWREQSLYTMDSRNQMLCGYYAFGETEMPRSALRLIAEGVREEGLLSLCYPTMSDLRIPSFSTVYFIQMEEYIRYSGDLSLAEECYDVLDGLMKTFIAKYQDNGLIENFYGHNRYWNFYEWSPTMSGDNRMNRSLEAPLNAFFSLALQSMAVICEKLGKTDKAAEYREMARKLNAAIADFFYNPETKLFETMENRFRGQYSVLTNSLCLLCGAADSVDKENILRILASNGKDNLGLHVIPNTLSMNSFRFDALLKEDRERYKPVILDEIDRDYLYMLREGATTFWETIAGEEDFWEAGSLCHGWSALPIYYYETLLG